MKKQYTKPELDCKAFAQFENVFTACDKNANKGCLVGGAETSSTLQPGSSAYSSNPSVS